MNKEYVINHLNIGLFIKDLMDKTSIYSMEFDIYQGKVIFFPSFINDKSQIVEWYEKPKTKLTTYYFSEQESVFMAQERTLPQLLKYFFQCFPIAKNSSFLNYLSEFMKKDIEDNFAFSFYKNSLGHDINKFWGNSVKSFLLQNKLEQQLSPTFKERLNKI